MDIKRDTTELPMTGSISMRPAGRLAISRLNRHRQEKVYVSVCVYIYMSVKRDER